MNKCKEDTNIYESIYKKTDNTLMTILDLSREVISLHEENNRLRNLINGLKDIQCVHDESEGMFFNREKLLELISCLDYAIYQEDEFTNKDQRRTLIDRSYDLMWDAADKLGIDLNDKLVDIETLEIKNFKGSV